MKLHTILYVNREDPRIFVYKHQQRKRVGITLNFSHTESFAILLVTLTSVGIPLLPMLLRPSSGVIWVSFALYVLWLGALSWYYFDRAAKDLKRYTGDQSAR